MNSSIDSFSIDQTMQVTYEMNEMVFLNYMTAFQDTNRIHTDEEIAKKLGFKGKVMHGGIINGFISNFIGVHFPGDLSLIHYVQIDYHSPLFLNDKVVITGKINQIIDSIKALVINLRITNNEGTLLAKAKVQVGFAFE